MTLPVTRGGLLVALAVFGVIVYQTRTVLEALGVSVPLFPYMLAVFVGAGIVILFVSFQNGWRTGSNEPT